MSVELTGELVRLRRPLDEDVADLVAMRSDPEHLRTGTVSLPLPVGPGWWQGFLASSQDPGDATSVGCVIEARDDGRLLGTCGYTVASPVHRVAVLGVGLLTEERGRGYGTDAVRTLVRFAFEQHGVAVVRLSVMSSNQLGLRAYEKAGFVEIGRRREAVWRDGRWLDDVEMARVNPDADAVPGPPTSHR